MHDDIWKFESKKSQEYHRMVQQTTQARKVNLGEN